MDMAARTGAWSGGVGDDGRAVHCIYNATDSDKRWFDLGFTQEYVDILEISFLAGNAVRHFFGCINNGSAPFDISFFMGNYVVGVNGMYNENVRGPGVFVFNKINNTITKNGKNITLTKIGDGTYFNNVNLPLLKTEGWTNDGASKSSTGVKFSYLKVFKDSQLTHHMIAWVDKDGVPCINDLITDEKIYSQGEGVLSFDE